VRALWRDAISVLLQPATTAMKKRAKTSNTGRWAGRLRWVTVAALALTSVSQRAVAQEASAIDKLPTAEVAEPAVRDQPVGGSEQRTAAPTGGRIQYVGPDTYILLDSAGRPQAMPGMSYEDFLAAWKKLNQASEAQSQPGYTIESIDFDGLTTGLRADLKLVARIRLHTEGTAVVPLGLVGAILAGQPAIEHEDAGAAIGGAGGKDERAPPRIASPNERLTYDPEHGGFTVRLVGRAGDVRTLSCDLLIPLLHDGAETSLPINCPRAVRSQLTLKVDSATSEVRSNVGIVVSQSTTDGGGTNIKVAGPAGLFRLTWQAAGKETPAISSVLNALGAIRVTVDGRGIRSDARLTVRSYGGSFDQFRVRLPAGAQLIQARPDTTTRQDANYRIRVEPDSVQPANDSGPRRQVVVVELPDKQPGPVVVDLTTELAGGVEQRGQEFDLGGFEVLGAVRQFGDIALNVASDWQTRWTVGSYVRQVDPSELDPTLQGSSPTAAFQYDRQPCSLKLRITPRQLRVHVTPKFEMQCLPEETRLTVRLAYQVFGARAFEFRVDLNGWEITGDPVESGGLVDQDRIVVIPDSTLVLPLAQASSRRAEVSFTLRRPTSRDSARLELPLPVPAADSVGTGELIVRAAPDIELLPDVTASAGLTAAPAQQAADSTGIETGTELRFRTLLPAATFVADRSNRPREISTQTSTQVELSQEAAQVEQRVDYSVRYEPAGELEFEVPLDMSLDVDKMEVSLLTTSNGTEPKQDEQGTPLHFTPSDDEMAELIQADTRLLRLMLPQPRIGRFAVRIRYRLPQPALGANDTVWLIPLPRPADGRFVSNRATVRAPRNLTVGVDPTVDDSSWKASPPSAENGSLNSAYVLTADVPEQYLPLTVRAGRPELASPTIVDRVWMQTWFANGVRQDRATFRFRTAGDQSTVELSPDAVKAEIEVLVDRQPAEVVTRGLGRIVVKLPQSKGNSASGAGFSASTHTLELRSRVLYGSNLLARHRLTPPQLEGSTALSQIYWHIVLPGDQHVVRSPDQLTSASEWQWLGSFFGRRPLRSQAELEEWASASEQLSPTDAQNQYLYTGLLPSVSSIEIVTAPRWLIVLAASGGVLASALLWIYAPAARRSWILGVAAIAIAALAIAYPTAAMLLAQASMVGVLLSALAYLLSRVYARPALVPIVPAAAASSQRMATPRMDSILMQPNAAASSTAPTASLHVSDSGR